MIKSTLREMTDRVRTRKEKSREPFKDAPDMGWEMTGDSHARDLIGDLILVPSNGRLWSLSPLQSQSKPAGPVNIAVDPEPLSYPNLYIQ